MHDWPCQTNGIFRMVGVLARLREHIATSASAFHDPLRADETQLMTVLLLAELVRTDFDVGDAEVDDVLNWALRWADGATSSYD